MIGTKVPDITLYDINGGKLKLSSFFGKVIYLDFWHTTCGPCIKLMPYEDTLYTRLHQLSLDTSIAIVKICDNCDEEKWKELSKKHNIRTNNYLYKGSHFLLQKKFQMVPYPTYHVVGPDFTFIGINVGGPKDTSIAYFLYRAMDNVLTQNARIELAKYSNGDGKLNQLLPEFFVIWLSMNQLNTSNTR